MKHQPISEVEILDEINSSYERMTLDQKRLWKLIKVTPKKWSEKQFGKIIEGFWVIAIIGDRVVWYNEIEEGFNQSQYHIYGKIDEYYCNQDELEWVIQNILNEIEGGCIPLIHLTPPDSNA